jgi:hypothetical protein
MRRQRHRAPELAPQPGLARGEHGLQGRPFVIIAQECAQRETRGFKAGAHLRSGVRTRQTSTTEPMRGHTKSWPWLRGCSVSTATKAQTARQECRPYSVAFGGHRDAASMQDGGVRPSSTRADGDDGPCLGFPRLTGQGLSRWGRERLTAAVRPTGPPPPGHRCGLKPTDPNPSSVPPLARRRWALTRPLGPPTLAPTRVWVWSPRERGGSYEGPTG